MTGRTNSRVLWNRDGDLSRAGRGVLFWAASSPHDRGGWADAYPCLIGGHAVPGLREDGLTTVNVAGSDFQPVHVLLERAEEKRLAGDYRAGCELARAAADRAASDGDGAGEAAALRSLANQLMRVGRQEEAIAACREAAVLLDSLGDRVGLCDVLTLQAMPLMELGMHDEALGVLATARDIAHALGDRELLYWVHNRTGVVHGSMGDRELGTACLMLALDMADGMNAEARFCILNNVSDNAVYEVPRLRGRGEAEAAERVLTGALGYVAEALRLALEADHPYRQAMSLDNYGMLLALAGDLDGAARLIEDSRLIAVRAGYRSLESAALQHQARVRLMRGEHAEAIEGLRLALDRAHLAGEKPMAMEISRELSEAHERIGDFVAALAYYRDFHDLERELHNQVAAARARMAAHHFELDNMRLEAENARLETELHRARSAELAADNVLWQRQATEDALTGLPNRRSADDRLPKLVAAGGPVCVAVADVDLFKRVNDQFGHFIGDEVLRRIAVILLDGIGETDLVARFGGEEFLIALHGSGIEDARARCELLRARVAAYPWDAIEAGLTVTISLGLAEVAGPAALPDALSCADQRLYEAKRGGRNRVYAG
ncbi:diguanylate cyclase (GGDEF)-like protein [Actinoplanes xinjiangensis]|jgi:diguanylate cyclase (GGDEF)-like protein|uniref:Diguanylate cyclase (GGDEF)-like protein n=1 Tax=Actinoplanes xinjiangensis TaxID=512350 RepID=A0A316FDQ4_9ACTN|nr:diguanylate cyclase (GGDEF)-like protein [Actinoplanes xinjiangensis]